MHRIQNDDNKESDKSIAEKIIDDLELGEISFDLSEAAGDSESGSDENEGQVDKAFKKLQRKKDKYQRFVKKHTMKLARKYTKEFDMEVL